MSVVGVEVRDEEEGDEMVASMSTSSSESVAGGKVVDEEESVDLRLRAADDGSGAGGASVCVVVAVAARGWLNKAQPFPFSLMLFAAEDDEEDAEDARAEEVRLRGCDSVAVLVAGAPAVTAARSSRSLSLSSATD